MHQNRISLVLCSIHSFIVLAFLNTRKSIQKNTQLTKEYGRKFPSITSCQIHLTLQLVLFPVRSIRNKFYYSEAKSSYKVQRQTNVPQIVPCKSKFTYFSLTLTHLNSKDLFFHVWECNMDNFTRLFQIKKFTFASIFCAKVIQFQDGTITSRCQKSHKRETFKAPLFCKKNDSISTH